MQINYVKTDIKSIINVSKIVTIHYYEFDKNFAFNGESHNFWEMVYVDTGKVLVSCNGNDVTLSQGDIIFHKPNEFHSIKALDSSPNFFVISFVSTSQVMEYFKGFYSKLDATLKPFISSIIKEAENAYIIPKNDTTLNKLIKRENAPVGSEQLIKLYLEQLLILLVRKIVNRGDLSIFPSKDSMENHLVKGVKEHVKTNLNGNFKVSDVCNKLGYSKTYLSKVFIEQTGYTIAKYSNVKKIEKAKELIREGTLNFSQIADSLSFDNPHYFSRVFKRITGITPTEFKNSLDIK